jgi:hypothetical protein
MEQGYDNQGELKDFVERHKLMDMYSNIHFKASVSIKTAKNEIVDEEMNVMITFDDFNSYGKVTLMGHDLEPTLYPTVLEAKWQKMIHVENVFLQISDIHKKNPMIGKYDVKIVPMGKLKK